MRLSYSGGTALMPGAAFVGDRMAASWGKIEEITTSRLKRKEQDWGKDFIESIAG